MRRKQNLKKLSHENTKTLQSKNKNKIKKSNLKQIKKKYNDKNRNKKEHPISNSKIITNASKLIFFKPHQILSDFIKSK